MRSKLGRSAPRGPGIEPRWTHGAQGEAYSPLTLPVHIAALICGAEFFDDRGDHGTSEFIPDYADFLESHIEPTEVWFIHFRQIRRSDYEAARSIRCWTLCSPFQMVGRGPSDLR